MRGEEWLGGGASSNRTMSLKAGAKRPVPAPPFFKI
jgi:hypothetical protein